MLVPRDKLLFTVIPNETVQFRDMPDGYVPKYEKWGSYDTFLAGNIERFCEYWGRGY